MRIRMITTAAGPNGVWPAGSEQVVDRETGETLARYGFAEVVNTWELATVAGREVASMTPAMERATGPATTEKPKPAKARTRKSGK